MFSVKGQHNIFKKIIKLIRRVYINRLFANFAIFMDDWERSDATVE